MTDFQIYMQMWKKIFMMWWPVAVFMILGLITLAVNERGDKDEMDTQA